MDLHDIVKDHPYRLTGKSEDSVSYSKILSDLFYKTKDAFANDSPVFKALYLMQHDFNCAMSRIYGNNSDKIPKAIGHSEVVLSVIHAIIEGLDFRPATHYFGCNTVDGVSRYTFFDYDERTSRWIPILSENEFVLRVSDLSSKYENNTKRCGYNFWSESLLESIEYLCYSRDFTEKSKTENNLEI